jgi:putative two-component system response regulator
LPEGLPEITPIPDFAQIATLKRNEFLRDQQLSRHERNVGRVCGLLCEAAGLERELASAMALAALLHDIGKLSVDDEILNKPGVLNDAEAAAVRRHAELGHDAIASLRDPGLELAARVALTHHERFDGTGYPYALKGEEIPVASRIITVCDVDDELRTDRPYKTGMAHDDAVAVLTVGDHRTAPHHYDPTFLRAFLRCSAGIAAIYGRAA